MSLSREFETVSKLYKNFHVQCDMIFESKFKQIIQSKYETNLEENLGKPLL